MVRYPPKISGQGVSRMDLTDEPWAVLQSIIPTPPRRPDGRGRPWREARTVLNGILWSWRTGAPWQDLPARDPLDEALAAQGIEMIAPHRVKRKKPKTQDGRPLRRYKRRWKVERLFAWLQNFRRVLVRHEYYAENSLGFVHLGCMVILLRWYL